MCVEDPDDVRVKMTISMTVREWCELRDQLELEMPSLQLAAKITDLLIKIRKIEYPDLEKPEPTP